MRISDWSSDVCSSDLIDRSPPPPPKEVLATLPQRERGAGRPTKRERRETERLMRSEERRVGDTGVSTCRYRWSPNQLNKKPHRLRHNPQNRQYITHQQSTSIINAHHK